jgi:hypothetical protein
MPLESRDDMSVAAARFVTLARRYADRYEPTLSGVMRNLKPGDVRQRLTIAGIAHVKIAGTVLVVGKRVQVSADPMEHERVAARGSANRRAVADYAANYMREIEAPIVREIAA